LALCAFIEDVAVNTQKPPIFISLLLVSLLAMPAVAHEAHQHAVPAATASNAAATLPPLAARYELKVNQNVGEWYLWREASSIETANPAAGQSTIWERTSADDFSYRRIFHIDKRVVEYSPGEIKTRNAKPDWAKLASVISPQLLDELKRGAKSTAFGQRAVRYTGKVGGQKIDVLWLEQAQLPARLQMSGKGQQMTMVLKDLYAQSPAGWPRIDETKIAAYGLIDAADFGDMESDPFVARLMQQEGHGHAH
jgi:hypothetical protein